MSLGITSLYKMNGVNDVVVVVVVLIVVVMLFTGLITFC